MTRTPAPALSAEELAVVARFDAAPVPAEVLLAEAVAEAMDAAYHFSNYRWPQQEDCPRIAAHLLPTVQRLIAEAEKRAAAAALREAADGAETGTWRAPIMGPDVAAMLRERAAALDTP